MYRSLFGAPLNKVVGPVLGMSIALAGLSACSTSPTETDQASPTQSGTAQPAATGETTPDSTVTLQVADAWAKAASVSAMHPMTGVFMTLTNTTENEMAVVSASSDVASLVQFHETVADENGSTVMQEIDGGIKIQAGETRVLEPGGDHVMLMGLTQDLIPGDSVELTLTLDDGEAIKVKASVREFSGAKEEYAHGETQKPEETKSQPQSHESKETHSSGDHNDH